MNLPGRGWADEDAYTTTEGNYLNRNQNEVDREYTERVGDGPLQLDQDEHYLNSPSSSNTYAFPETTMQPAEMPTKPMVNQAKKFKHLPYKKFGNKLNSKPTAKDRILKDMAYINQCKSNHQIMEEVLTPPNSTLNIPSDCYKIREVGQIDSQDPFVSSLYITAYNSTEDQVDIQVAIDQFADTLDSIASGKIKLQKTFCGVIIAFTKEDDANKVIKLHLPHILGRRVQVAKFQTGESRFRQNIIIKDVPWCISDIELQEALKRQGIIAGKIVRLKANVKIEVLSALDRHRLVEEGLNFFNYASFPAVVENTNNQMEPDIIQCFKCQGFWHTSTHCRQRARCVRCGENHEVEYCPRPRKAAICCHCGGPHHAAYKLCPVRLQLINSTYVAFHLAKTKPTRSGLRNMF